MKNFRIALLIVASLGVSAFAAAQSAGPKTGGQQGSTKGAQTGQAKKLNRADLEKMQNEIFDKIHLTADQKAKFKAHEEKSREDLKKLRKDLKGLTPEQRREKMKPLREANQKFLKETLTKEQLKEFVKLRREKLKELRKKLGNG